MSETVTLTNMCMIYSGNRVVVQERTAKSWPGIAFPGGHVEKGESFADAVIREVFEETGLTIYAPKLCGIKDWVEPDGGRYIVLFYKTDRFTGELTSSEEGQVFWTDLDTLSAMPLASGMRDMLKVFLDDTLSEFYGFSENGEWIYLLK